MNDRRTIAGIAALVAAAAFVVGFVMFVTVLSDYTTGDPSPGESVAFLVDNEMAMYAWNLVIFIVFGLALVPLVLALHDRLRSGSPAVAQTATAFGLIWAGLVIAAGMVANVGWVDVIDLYDEDPARAESLWSAIDSVQNGLGGGNEIAGGAWVLLVSLAALRASDLSSGINYLGLIAGAAGLVTVIPALEAVGAVFGLGLIVWFVWAGVILLREQHAPPVGAERFEPPTASL